MQKPRLRVSVDNVIDRLPFLLDLVVKDELRLVFSSLLFFEFNLSVICERERDALR
jgi:hypothetical protein